MKKNSIHTWRSQTFAFHLSIFILLLLFLPLVSCGPRRGVLRIRGQFQNLTQADLLIYSPDGGLPTVDTLHIIKGQFDYQTRVAEEATHTYVVIYPNYSTLTFRAHPGTDIRITGDALSLAQVRVQGADTVISSPAEAHSTRRAPLTIGHRLPKTKIIPRRPGHYLLINFWADWKHGSSVTNYYAAQALHQHPDSLHVLSYSLDVDPTANQPQREPRDTARWHIHCDYTGWNAPLLSQLGIRNIPHLLLLSPQGILVAQGTDYNRDIKPAIDRLGD